MTVRSPALLALSCSRNKNLRKTAIALAPLAHSGGHLLEEHLKAVARLVAGFSARYATSAVLQQWAYLVGLWCDLGKNRWNTKIRRALKGMTFCPSLQRTPLADHGHPEMRSELRGARPCNTAQTGCLRGAMMAVKYICRRRGSGSHGEPSPKHNGTKPLKSIKQKWLT